MENPTEPGEIRKAKIFAFIEKDNFVLNNYETAAFKNRNHAVESLIPYHIFSSTADDIKYKGSDIEIDFKKQIETLRLKLLSIVEEQTFDDECFTPQLLLYHEQNYLNTLAKQSMTQKKKKSTGKTNLKIRIKRTGLYYVYGTVYKLRICRH